MEKNRVNSAVKTDPKVIEVSVKKIITDSLKPWPALLFFWLGLFFWRGLTVLSILNDNLANR